MRCARGRSGALAVAVAAAGSIIMPLGVGVAAATPSPITVINLGDLGQPGAAASQQVAINAGGRVVGSLFVNSGGSRAFSWTASTGMVDLGTSSVFGDPSSLGAAVDVNDAGEVAGNVSATHPSAVASAFTWTAAGGLELLPALHFGDTATAVAINNAGQVIGNETPASGPSDAVIWTPGRAVAALGALGTGGAQAVAINDSGQVVGLSSNASRATDAFSWTVAGGMTDLGSLGGGSSEATAVSNDGMVVGFSYASGFPSYVHAFAWTVAGGMVDLGTLGDTSSQAVAVNAVGQVVGEIANRGGSFHAFSWTAGGGMVDLGDLGGGASQAYAVSDSGEVVGSSTTATGGTDAFSWTAAGGMVDLGNLAGDSGRAVAVNDAGQIAGYSYAVGSPGGRYVPTLWEPADLIGTVPAGGSSSTSPGTASAATPLVVNVTSPVAGPVAIDTTPPDTTVPGYGRLGVGATITAPAGSAQQPLQLSFQISDTVLPPGNYPSDLTVIRDGAPVSACTGAPGTAVPDPCTTSASTTGGVTTIDVLSSDASRWDVEAVDVARIAGADRIGTAVAASQDSYPSGGAAAVVLAKADDYPDALVGAPLAAAKDAPLLLTEGATLTPATQAEITRVLAPGGTVYVLGGPSAVPPEIGAELAAAGYQVVRYGGADRFATAIAVAGALGDPTTVLLASGLNYPDALTAGPAAAHAHAAVLLTDGSTLPSAVSAYLKANATTVYAIGGPAALADPDAHAVVGSDRYATAVDVAAEFFTAPVAAGVATGLSFADALSGGAQLATAGAPLLLATETDLPAETTSYLSAQHATLLTAHLYGGTAALGVTVQQELASAIGQ